MIPLASVPPNKELLWFFDDEMTHDLIFIPSAVLHDNVYRVAEAYSYDKIILVERATIYGYSPKQNWVENLFTALLPHSQQIKSDSPTFERIGDILNTTYTVTIPAVSGQDIGKEVVIVYHIPTYKLILNRVVEVFHLHHKIYTLKSEPQQITIGCLSNSGYCTTPVATVKGDIDAQLQTAVSFAFPPEGKQLLRITTEYSYDSHCTLVATQQLSDNLGLTDVLLYGELNNVTPFITTNIEETINLPARGALIYAYPFHPPLQRFRVSTNQIIGNVRLIDYDYNIVHNLYNNAVETIKVPEYADRFGNVVARLHNYTEWVDYVKNYALGVVSIKVFTDDVLDDSLINKLEAIPIIAVDDSLNNLSVVDGDILALSGLKNGASISPSEVVIFSYPVTFPSGNVSWVRAIDILNSSAVCEIPRNQFEIEVFTLCHLDLDLEDYLPIDWLEARERYYNSNSILRAYVEQDLPLSVTYFASLIPSLITPNATDYYNSLFPSYSVIEPVLYPSNWGTATKVIPQVPVFSSVIVGSNNRIIPLVDLSYPISSTDLLSLLFTKMNENLLLQEVHACLGAGEFSYYTDANGDPQPYYMSMARLLTRLSRAYGVAFNPDGSIMPVPRRMTRQYDASNQVTIPDGYTRGQFDDFPETPEPDLPVMPPDTVGISYQNRCNKYINFDDADPSNNIMRRGDVVLCHNFLQYMESMLEDLDKGLNWQEMGTAIMPSADGTSYCTYEGMGTLLAEVAYMLSALSDNIYQTHNLSLVNYRSIKEVIKMLGVPLTSKALKVKMGEKDIVNPVDELVGYLPHPAMADDAPSITQQIGILLSNIALILSNYVELPEPTQPNP